MPTDTPDHSSRKATEANGYQRLRDAGVRHADAVSIARKASETVHRNVDKQNSDRGGHGGRR